MLIGPLTVLPIHQPLTFVVVAFRGFPHPVAIFGAHFPFALKGLAIVPDEFTFSMSFAIKEFPYVCAIYVAFDSGHFYIVLVNSLENLFLANHQG